MVVQISVCDSLLPAENGKKYETFWHIPRKQLSLFYQLLILLQ
jgi:hypothetical protein